MPRKGYLVSHVMCGRVCRKGSLVSTQPSLGSIYQGHSGQRGHMTNAVRPRPPSHTRKTKDAMAGVVTKPTLPGHGRCQGCNGEVPQRPTQRLQGEGHDSTDTEPWCSIINIFSLELQGKRTCIQMLIPSPLKPKCCRRMACHEEVNINSNKHVIPFLSVMQGQGCSEQSRDPSQRPSSSGNIKATMPRLPPRRSTSKRSPHGDNSKRLRHANLSLALLAKASLLQ